MSEFNKRAEELRNITDVHYNCAQAVLMPFADKIGIDEDKLFRITSNFGSGMKRGATCGAISAGLMVLGLFGVDDAVTIGAYYNSLKDNHEGKLDCMDLLRINKEKGGDRKTHCDGMIQEVINLVEQILTEKGLI